VALGDDFSIALGLTLPCVDIDRLAKSNGILRLKPEKPSESSGAIKRLKKRTPSRERNDTKSSGGKINYMKLQQENYAPIHSDLNSGMPLRKKSSDALNSTIKAAQHDNGIRNQTKSQNFLKNITTKTVNETTATARSAHDSKPIFGQEEKNREIYELT
jgi:hypothetical protein